QIIVNQQSQNSSLHRFTYTDERDGKIDVGLNDYHVVLGFGDSLAFLGDVNGDGKNDYLFGEPYGSNDYFDYPGTVRPPELAGRSLFRYRAGRCHIVFGHESLPNPFDTNQLNGKNGFLL